ncbi:unnamed protein product [Leptidea sinapis]|uniref:Uncharacterized protein n=1 Tax=Leptidea sinapis TaxID=189913 RepID=A0A5E4QTI0_9NEOP|nr:unnamed protein product [Leptidea sinapis]
MQHIIQANPIMERLKHFQQVFSFRYQLTTSQKRIQRAINKRISRMRSPNGGMGSVVSSGGRSSPLGFNERLSVASGSNGSAAGDASPLSPQQLGVMVFCCYKVIPTVTEWGIYEGLNKCGLKYHPVVKLIDQKVKGFAHSIWGNFVPSLISIVVLKPMAIPWPCPQDNV